MRLKLTLVLFFFLPFSANAIEFELPSGSNVDQAQLQDVDDDYDTVCDSALSSSCDVPAGQYQVVVYRLNWSQVERTPIELVDPAASTSITMYPTLMCLALTWVTLLASSLLVHLDGMSLGLLFAPVFGETETFQIQW